MALQPGDILQCIHPPGDFIVTVINDEIGTLPVGSNDPLDFVEIERHRLEAYKVNGQSIFSVLPKCPRCGLPMLPVGNMHTGNIYKCENNHKVKDVTPRKIKNVIVDNDIFVITA